MNRSKTEIIKETVLARTARGEKVVIAAGTLGPAFWRGWAQEVGLRHEFLGNGQVVMMRKPAIEPE